MTRKGLWSFLAAASIFLATMAPASAEDVYVDNRPYKGQMTGFGMDTEFEVHELAEALKVEAVSDNGYWILGKVRVPARREKTKFYTTLRDLKAGGMIVVQTPSLETIDISEPKE